MANNIMVISGPSGCGKSTLIRKFLQNHPEAGFSVSHTTRQRRPGEVDGRDYHFVPSDEFMKMRQEDQFVEWAEVHNHLYGTSRQEVDGKAQACRVVILDVDVQGARQIKNHLPGATFILVTPPDMEELERRLLERERPAQGKGDQAVRQRLKVARQELKQYPMYNYVVVNDEIEKALQILDAIYTAILHSSEVQGQFIEKLLGEGV
jgi:guanylate kinase